jgi:hypothetical protein
MAAQQEQHEEHPQSAPEGHGVEPGRRLGRTDRVEAVGVEVGNPEDHPGQVGEHAPLLPGATVPGVDRAAHHPEERLGEVVAPGEGDGHGLRR